VVEVILGLLSAHAQQGRLLLDLAFDEPGEQMEELSSIGWR
jgi:hypothetical protein